MQQTAMELGNQIRFTETIDHKFRSNYVCIRFRTPRNAENAPIHALLTDVLTESSADYPSRGVLALKLDSLYAADFSGRLCLIGDTAELVFTASWLDDRYALYHEEITREMLELIIGCFLRPNIQNNGFCNPEFRICKQNLIDDIDCRKNDKREYALEKAAALAFQNEPAAIPIHGERHYAEKITPQTAYQTWQQILSTSSVEIYCVTPQHKPIIRDYFHQAFNSFNRFPPTMPFLAPSPCKEISKTVEEIMQTEQSKLVLAFKFNNLNHEELVMLEGMLSGISDSLLFTNVREKQQLCYYILMHVSTFKNTVFIDCGIDYEQVSTAISTILTQFSTIQCGLFSDDMKEKVALRYERLAAEMSDSASGIASMACTDFRRQETRSPQVFSQVLRTMPRETIMNAAKQLVLDSVYILRANTDSPEDYIE
ncbi:MAG: insulinase family protein [Oscillospiraceae bacterium]|nr:insulinase family protein [Oscillospiraceae bacterium]